MRTRKYVPAISRLVSGLSDKQTNAFARITARFEEEGSEEHISRLQADLSDVRSRIQEVNTERKALGKLKEDLLTVAQATSDFAQDNGDILLEFDCLVRTLIDRVDFDIAKTRPEDLHVRKATLKQEIRRRKQLAQLARKVGGVINGD